MATIGQWEIILRLCLAALLGGFIGLERESHRRPAGLRTHILVCLGSALVMLISVYAFSSPNRDPARLAAQVVSGIGFLGAGTIMREGSTIKGLTTAASLWVVSGIGLAAGSGFYLAAAFATGLVVVILGFMESLEPKLLTATSMELRITMDDRPGAVGRLGTLLGNLSVNISAVELEESQDKTQAIAILRLSLPPSLQRMQLLDQLSGLEGINKVQVMD
jgi:putative Mg2+ transporter-C (MgtC) family protein